MLHGMSVRRPLAHRMVFMEAKESSLLVVEEYSAIWIRADGNHG